MKPLIPSPDLATHIQRRIDDLHPKSLGEWPMRVCKEDLNALPLQGNIIYLWAIRPDGSVLCMDHESLNHPTELETDPLVIYAVLVEGARTYPELQALVPPRPVGAQPCDLCQTDTPLRAEGAITHCFKCRGLGWFIPGK